MFAGPVRAENNSIGITATPVANLNRTVLAFVGVLTLAAFVRAIFFAGLFGSDDLGYSTKATEIAAGIWRPSVLVGELRYGINIPISIFVRLFGANELALSGWSLLCSMAEVVLVFGVANYVWGLRAAVLAGVVIALSPIHVILGTSPLADAPLAFLFSLALVAFFFAEQSGKSWLYVVTGVAAGAAWWVKPHAAVPFAFVFATYALVWRVWRREWLLVIFAGACVVALELAMFWAVFGDPLYAIRVILRGIDKNYINIQSDPLWGTTSPFFYFRQMFLDGRDMWITPYLALAGLMVLAREELRGDKLGFGSRYVAFWAVGLLCIFSFFIFSVNPLKLIPKQDNYAIIFFAPLALLAGYALSRTSGVLLASILCLFAAGAMALSALQAYAIQLHYSALKKTVSFGEEHPDALVFVSHQAISTAYLARLASGAPDAPDNLAPIGSLLAPDGAGGSSAGRPRFAVADPSTPEFVKPDQATQLATVLSKCWQKVGIVRPEAGGIGRHVVGFLAWLRPLLPRSLDRYLSFTNALIAPREAEVFRLQSQSCEK